MPREGGSAPTPTTVAGFWRSYQREVLPADAPAIQVQECRRAFYGGLKAGLALLLTIGDDEITEDQGADLLEALLRECRAFQADVLEGRA